MNIIEKETSKYKCVMNNTSIYDELNK